MKHDPIYDDATMQEILESWEDEEWERRAEPIPTYRNRSGEVFVKLAP